MSSDFYFVKWKKVLKSLETILETDLDHQTSKAHDQRRCEATLRLSTALARYSAIYNEAVECLQHNTQVQKKVYLEEVVRAVEKRILELKHELRTLECSECHFVGNGIAREMLTPDNTQLNYVRIKFKRSEEINNIIREVFQKIADDNVIAQHEENKTDIVTEKVANWWDDDYQSGETETIEEKSEDNISENTMKKIQLINLIKSHEKSRQVITVIKRNTHRRWIWEKELRGTLVEAKYTLRERSAKLILLVLRAYFEIKRKKVLEKRRDEILGIQFKEFSEPIEINTVREKELKFNKYQEECEQQFLKTKQKIIESKGPEIMEDYRDFIRNWFYEWYKKIKLFHELPKDKEGGLKLIIKEEIPSPEEWLEEYNKYLQEKKSNKNKTALQIKWEKMDAKRELKLKEREKMKQKKMEAELKRKMMKNPDLHPGFFYPTSQKTEFIAKALEHYHKDWDDLDEQNTLDVKEKFVEKLNVEDSWKNAKLELLDDVQEDMRNEYKKLKAALVKDYAIINEKLPVLMKKLKKTKAKRFKIHKVPSVNLSELIESLVKKGVIIDYPKTKLEDFIGDYNFAGEDFRCSYRDTMPFNGDLRTIWWNICRDSLRSPDRILLVSPGGCGKSKLVHILATLQDAVLFVLDPAKLRNELTIVHLEILLKNIKDCAVAVQPTVIYVKDLQLLFSRKKLKEDFEISPNLMRRYIMKKVLKPLHKMQHVTIIGGCTDPWKVRSRELLKRFPRVVLMPNSSYSLVLLLIQDWVIRNHEIPNDFDIHSLAYVLQGYSYGYLKEVLQSYLTPERILEIAINGLSPSQLLDYIIKDDQAVQCDYTKYRNWYLEKTHWGRKEKQHLEEQREFINAVEKFAKKKKNAKDKMADDMEAD